MSYELIKELWKWIWKYGIFSLNLAASIFLVIFKPHPLIIIILVLNSLLYIFFLSGYKHHVRINQEKKNKDLYKITKGIISDKALKCGVRISLMLAIINIIILLAWPKSIGSWILLAIYGALTVQIISNAYFEKKVYNKLVQGEIREIIKKKK